MNYNVYLQINIFEKSYCTIALLKPLHEPFVIVSKHCAFGEQIICYCVMKRKESWNNWQNQERKQFVYLERKIESFSTHALRKIKQKKH